MRAALGPWAFLLDEPSWPHSAGGRTALDEAQEIAGKCDAQWTQRTQRHRTKSGASNVSNALKLLRFVVGRDVWSTMSSMSSVSSAERSAEPDPSVTNARLSPATASSAPTAPSSAPGARARASLAIDSCSSLCTSFSATSFVAALRDAGHPVSAQTPLPFR